MLWKRNGGDTVTEGQAAAIERVKKGFRELRTAQSREEVRNALREIGVPDHELPGWLGKKKIPIPH
jgi:hypothetical protein